jgi:hypothetical protein
MRNVHRAPHLAQLEDLGDIEREAAIRAAHQWFAPSQDRTSRLAAWRIMVALINGGSLRALKHLLGQGRGLAPTNSTAL